MIQNIVIGTPLVGLEHLLAINIEDWELNERKNTMFTEQRSLPVVLKEAGIVPSTGEVRRNRPELIVSLDKPDCFWVKWGKKRVYIVVGE
jgi:hypothetical protein